MSIHDTGKLFFSMLGSVCTISECIPRKLRGFLMVVSLDCTNLNFWVRELRSHYLINPKKSSVLVAVEKGEEPIYEKGKSCS